MKGIGMILSEFLPRANNDTSNPHEIILISLNMQEVLHANHYNIHETDKDKYLFRLDLKLILVTQLCLKYMV